MNVETPTPTLRHPLGFIGVPPEKQPVIAEDKNGVLMPVEKEMRTS
jgi:hypothetical protein